MPWNWELPEWPAFQYQPDKIAEKERLFLLGVGGLFAYLRNIEPTDYKKFAVEVLSSEGVESFKIEGEILDRESLQSSIRAHFGLQKTKKKDDKESRMAKLLCDTYESFDEPLTHEMLFQWHATLFDGSLESCGRYRTHLELMQIVSNRLGVLKVFFEAPPSSKVFEEMERFIKWFNLSANNPILERAAISHLYFESIHPFEDGNGRIGRLLVEKVLSQGVKRPLLIAVSKCLEKRKKEYYAALDRCNKTLDVAEWVVFFADVILQAQTNSIELLCFLIAKTKVLMALSGSINPRQEKVLLRMFAEGPSGFKGGLSAENYIRITHTSRATATRDLADLVERGVLIKTGELRHTRYWLNLDSCKSEF